MSSHRLQQLFREAETAHRSGQLGPAESLYRRILSEQPVHPPALSMLGLLYAQQQRLGEALPLLQQACEILPGNVPALINLGEILRRMQRPDEARQAFERALAHAPAQPDAWFNLGLLLAADEPEAALEAFTKALSHRPEHPRARAELAAHSLKLQRHEQALAQLEQAFALGQRSAQNLVNYCLARSAAEPDLDPEAQRAWLHEALQKSPDYYAALENLAALELKAGSYVEAQSRYERLAALRPTASANWLGLADSLVCQNRPGRAIEQLERGLLKLAADDRPPLFERIASLCFKLKEIELAKDFYFQALSLDPERISSLHGLATLHERQGELAQAKPYYDRLQSLRPDADILSLHRELLLPVVLPDPEAVAAQEAHLHEVLDRWLTREIKVGKGELGYFTGQSSFMLTYHTRGSGRELREKFAKIFRPLIPRREPLPNHGKPHVGFLVTSSHEFIFAKSVCGMLNHFDTREIRYTVMCPRAGFENMIRPRLTNEAIEWLDLPASYEEAAEAVAAARFDILNFWEIGTDTQNFLLPFYRLAPVQTLSWGWPLTSGNPEVDYYLSSSHLEAGAGQAAYSEQLHCFSLLPAYYYRPPTPARLRSRAELGLDTQARIYFCSQNLFKLHPDFDQALAGILATDPKARIMLLEDRLPAVNASLRARLERSCQGLAGRIDFVARRPFEDYLNLVAVSDLILDPYHYVGANTSFDAFALDVPVLTLPTPYHRGRHSYAAYQEMGIFDAVATDQADYVSRAVDLACNRDRRQALVEAIKERRDVLYENPRIVSEYEAFFRARLNERS